jgi:hypothetical protein
MGRSVQAKLSLWMVLSAVIGSVSRLSATRLFKLCQYVPLTA